MLSKNRCVVIVGSSHSETHFLLLYLSDKGDLPLHLLVRSGSANQVAVEILLTPIMHSTSVCAFEGSVGVNLPLHIAAEFRVKYAILEVGPCFAL